MTNGIYILGSSTDQALRSNDSYYLVDAPLSPQRPRNINFLLPSWQRAAARWTNWYGRTAEFLGTGGLLTKQSARSRTGRTADCCPHCIFPFSFLF